MSVFYCKFCILAVFGVQLIFHLSFGYQDENQLEKTVYKIDVITANALGAGTDANVFIKIFGSKGVTDIHHLHKSGNQFEKGNTDTFFIEDVNVGKLIKIAIKRDRKWWYILSPWKLQSITIRSYEPTVYHFVFNQWIPPNKWVEKLVMEPSAVKNDEATFNYQ